MSPPTELIVVLKSCVPWTEAVGETVPFIRTSPPPEAERVTPVTELTNPTPLLPAVALAEPFDPVIVIASPEVFAEEIKLLPALPIRTP
jgi:hypothetical protein